MSSIALAGVRGDARNRWTLLALLAVLAAAAGLLALAPARASATACTDISQFLTPPANAPLPGSCFEGYDGNQIDSDGTPNTTNPRLDWQSILSITNKADDFVSGGSDSQFGPGGSEETPDSWTFDLGSLGSDKYDIVNGYSAQEPGTNDLFLALAFVRASNNGTSHLAFELNQKQPGYRTATEDGSNRTIKVPTRSPGDLLITYSVDPPVIGLCKWGGDEHTGHWLNYSGTSAAGSNCPQLNASVAQGAMNATDIQPADDYLKPGTKLDAKTFAEASINLTEAIKGAGGDPNTADPCVNFGYLWMHSRSSISITSNQQDYILPSDAIKVANCSVSGTKWQDVNGNGLRDGGDNGLGGWTFYVDYNDNGVLDANEPSAVSAANGSYTIGGVKNGTWKVKEVGQSGWSCTSPSPCNYSVTMTGADIPNTDFGNFQPGTIKIKKVTVGGNGSFDFTHGTSGTTDVTGLTGGSTSAGQNVAPGSYDFTEVAQAGWDLTALSCDDTDSTTNLGTGKATFKVAAGETVICTYTNTKRGTLKIAKVGVGGSGTFDFDTSDAGAADILGLASGATSSAQTVKPGTYSYVEAAQKGWNLTGIACDDGSSATPSTTDLATSKATFKIDPGEDVKCTFTNTAVKPKVTVIKHVINDNGGTAVASDFTMNVTATNPSSASFPGAESPGTDVTFDPGTYSVAEGTHTGYDVTYSAGCSGTLALGDTATCTVTNNDIPPKLTVIKHVINDDGGTKTASDFTMSIDDPGTNPASFAGAESPGTTTEVDAGAYSVSEGAHAGYADTYSTDCTGSIKVGETKTCTVTNNDIAPKLTVIKHVINDDGGTKTASDFTMTVDDPGTNPASFAGAESPGTDVKVDPGSYSVSEGAHAGYADTYSTDCTGTIAIGETKTCTVTNNDIAPKLTVIKHVINDDGGTKTASDFTMTVDDPGTNPASFPGAESPGTDVKVDPGAYNVTEGDHTGYAVTYSTDCTGSIAIGQTKTCTVTNDDIAPKLTVIKHVVNNDGGTKVAGDFTMSIDDPGTNPASFPGAESPGTTTEVDPGAYSVSEGAHAGYADSYSTDCTGTIAIGETKTCTVTNDDIKAQVIVIKHVVNDDGGTAAAADFSMTVDDPGTNPASQPGKESPGQAYSVDPGAYSVSETGPSGYAASYSADCSSTVSIGETKTCTVTNDDIAPELTVIKHVINDNGGTKSASDFTMTIDDPGTNPASFPGAESPGTTKKVDPGSYSVSEGAHAGYADTYSTDCTGTIAIGEKKTCTVTNNDIAPQLTVIKHVINDDGGTKSASDFTMTIDDPGTNPPSFPGSESPGTTKAVDPGAYSVSEGAHAGYADTYSADCTGTIAIGETKTCTVTNNDIAPKLTVIKHVINDDGGTAKASDFTMTVDDPGTNPADFPGAESPGTDIKVDPGAYNVTEGDHTGYAVTYSTDCTGSIAIGQTKTCTVTNDDIAPVLTVIKHVINDNGGNKSASDFTMTVDDPGTNPADFAGAESPGTDVTVDPGDYKVTEGDHAGYAVSYSTDCQGTLKIGETKTCTVTNDDIEAQVIVIKHVINDNGGSAVASDFTMNVDDPGTDPASKPGMEDPGQGFAVDPGAYSVTESGGPSGYTASYSDDCTGSVANGETKTCTITNDDVAPQLTVIKHVINDNGGTKAAGDFTMNVDATNASDSSFAGSESPGKTVTVDAGAYDVTEGAHAGYDDSYSEDCTGTIAVGQSKTCTVTNNDQPVDIEVDKKVSASSGGPFVDGPVTVHNGDTVYFQMAVTNPGSARLTVDFSDPKCDTGTLAGPVKTGGNQDAFLDHGETWTYTCSHKINDADTAAKTFTNTATAKGTAEHGGSDTDTDSASANVITPSTLVVKEGNTTAYHGDTVHYTFTVTNSGNTPLSNVKVTDDHCTVGATPESKSNDDGDALLENPGVNGTSSEVWVFGCDYKIPDHSAGEENPIHNTATASGQDSLGKTVTGTDDHNTTILHPAVAIDKSGPATANQGDSVPYTLVVTNPGDTPIVGQTLAVTDPLCDSPPSLVGKTRGNVADPTPDTLDPGDSWVYTCSVQTTTSTALIDNVANVNGKDVNGKPVSATDNAQTALAAVLPEVIESGAAKLSGPASCVKKNFAFRVTGKHIAKVVFKVDGKTAKTVKIKGKNGKKATFKVNPKKYGQGLHKLTARITFNKANKTAPKTLRAVFEKCKKLVIKPQFTG